MTKLSSKKANMLNIKALNEKEIIGGALAFLKRRFNAEVSVYNEDDGERYDPEQRALIAMPNQPKTSLLYI